MFNVAESAELRESAGMKLRDLARAQSLQKATGSLSYQSGMSTLADTARTAAYCDGFVIVSMESGRQIRFPVADNPRLAHGTPVQLNRLEISPFGLHRPDLDDDLSFAGLLEGDHGQR